VSLRHAIAAGGAAWALAAAVASAQPATPTVIAVQLSDFRYSPATIELNRGQSYVLRLTNGGKHGHDLKAKAFFEAVSLAADSAAKVQDGSVELAAGETTDVALTPNAAGSYEMHCTHPFHATMGMKGQIVVH
jgi:plastocyanin